MNLTYDKYYRTENFFGEPYPELMSFLAQLPSKGNLLDLGCGQGRNAIPLAHLGYNVTGIDNSQVGIEQMNIIARDRNLNLTGVVGDIYSFDQFDQFDIVLLDSMFHFAKKDKEREIDLIKRIITEQKTGDLLVICIQDTGNKVQILHEAIDFDKKHDRLADKPFKYTFVDRATGHRSETNYRLLAVKK